jgi:hypothetical protein
MILNLKNIGMCYVKYDWDIISKHKVKIVGWPKAVKFANPSEIRTVDEIQKLCQTLKLSKCKWVAQFRRQQAAHTEMLATKVAASELVVKKRKQRSDKGKMRGKGGGKSVEIHEKGMQDERGGSTGNENDNDDDNGGQPPKKRQKHVTTGKARVHVLKKLLPTPKSKLLIDESDDNDNK